MTSADWPPVDVNPVSLPTIVSTSDLFDGELFGDELIDIYDSNVGDVNNEIPQLLPSEHSADDKHHSIEDNNHPGAHVAAIAAAMDDGLGAFRPSTSFNDLSTLLSPTSNVNTNVPVSVTDTTKSPTQKGSKKRSSSVSSSNGPATKRKTPPSRGSRRPSTTLCKKQSAPVTKDVIPLPTISAPISSTIHVVVNPNGIENIPNPVTIEKITSESVQTAAKIVEKSAVVLHEANIAEAAAASMESDESCNGASEADFRSIAQAAVSNLIMTASTSTKNEALPSSTSSSSKIDTSTAHIKALTGNNWVSACTGTSNGVSSNNSDCNDNKSNNRARRQNLTPDERARQNRDRNREHARNTRLRKKAYVEELKRTLTELVAQRDAADSEKRQAAQREQEQREVRFRVLEEFLKLRGRNERNVTRWAAILEEGFSLTAPVTPYRKANHKLGVLDQVLCGVNDVMEDSNNFSQFLQQLGANDPSPPVVFQFNCDRSNFFMDDCTAVLEWNASSVGALSKGAASELALRGVLRGRFSPASNKLVSANMTFDTSPIFLHHQKHDKISLSSTLTFSSEAEAAAAAAAEVAASEANAILDSLEMPRLSSPVPTAVTVVHPSSESSESSSKGEMDSDESVGFATEHFKKDITTRRVTRSSSLSLPE